MRDVMAGEGAVKGAGEKYLPRLDSQSDEEFAAYVKRGSFFNATARTAEAYLGLIFRRPPFLKLPSGGSGVGRSLEEFVNDADMLGTSLTAYAKIVVGDVISLGRAATLVDWEEDAERFSNNPAARMTVLVIAGWVGQAQQQRAASTAAAGAIYEFGVLILSLTMDDHALQVAVAAWAARGLPARLDTTSTAKLLGFAEHDIQILLRTGKLTALGDPAPNAPKWFAAVELIRLAADRDWLTRASRDVSRYWRHKRERSTSGRLRRRSSTVDGNSQAA